MSSVPHLSLAPHPLRTGRTLLAAGLMASKCHLFRANGQACPRHYREPAIYG